MSVSIEKLSWRRDALEIGTHASPPARLRQPSLVLSAYRSAVRTSDGSGRRSFGARKVNISAADASCRSVRIVLPAASSRLLLLKVTLVVTRWTQVIASARG